jgi:hypothetical protein
MPSRRSGRKIVVFGTEKADLASKILVLWHVVARNASANRRIAPLPVSYFLGSDCA